MRCVPPVLTCVQLPLDTLAKCSLLNREMNALATPYLYKTLHLHSPGRISGLESFLSKLELMANCRFEKIKFTRRVLVTGYWCQIYKDTSQTLFGPESLACPDIRMLNALISCCVVRMPQLREFMYA